MIIQQYQTSDTNHDVRGTFEVTRSGDNVTFTANYVLTAQFFDIGWDDDAGEVNIYNFDGDMAISAGTVQQSDSIHTQSQSSRPLALNFDVSTVSGTTLDVSYSLTDDNGTIYVASGPASTSFAFKLTTFSTTSDFTGTSSVDMVFGSAGNDYIEGRGGDDFLSGSQGDDYLDGGLGNDRMEGGAGDDGYAVNSLNDIVDETGGSGHDTIVVGLFSYSLYNNSSVLGDVERLMATGAKDINLTGNALDNGLSGNAGDNVLNGLGGADIMSGGAGNDTYYVDNLHDLIIDYSRGDRYPDSAGLTYPTGIDSVYSTVGFNLSDKDRVTGVVENLFLIGTGNTNAIGSGIDNKVRGNNGNNIINGLGGNDILTGLAGNDDMIGGAGNDRMDGGKGNDTLYGGFGADRLHGDAGADTFVYRSVADSRVAAASRDTIDDFAPTEHDRIDLSAIDAISGTKANDAFHFIGAQDFHGKAGELRYEQTSGDTYVYADVNGDGKADFAIHIDLPTALTAGNFIL